MNLKFVIVAFLACRLTIISGLAQGCFGFNNFAPIIGIDAPVLDAGGSRLEGTNYLTSLYGAATAEALQALGAPLPFRTGSRAGYVDFFSDGGLRTVTGVPGGAKAFVQMRAWDASLATTFEEVARLGIGGYGESIVLHLQTGCCFQCDAAPLTGLQSFSLRPLSGVAITSIGQTNDQIVFKWYGVGRRYQVQQTSTLDQVWENVGSPTTDLSVTNSIIGTHRFFRVVALQE